MNLMLYKIPTKRTSINKKEIISGRFNFFLRFLWHDMTSGVNTDDKATHVLYLYLYSPNKYIK